jgi:ABC-2 type transport system ATP-binding protein
MCLTLMSAEPKALETIQNMGFASGHDERHNSTFRVKHADDVQKILSALKSAGLALPGLDVRKPNLEEVFLSLTGEELGEAAPPPGTTP